MNSGECVGSITLTFMSHYGLERNKEYHFQEIKSAVTKKTPCGYHRRPILDASKLNFHKLNMMKASLILSFLLKHLFRPLPALQESFLESTFIGNPNDIIPASQWTSEIAIKALITTRQLPTWIIPRKIQRCSGDQTKHKVGAGGWMHAPATEPALYIYFRSVIHDSQL